MSTTVPAQSHPRHRPIAEWDAWLNMHCDAHRVAPVGSRTDDETQQQRLSRQLDQEFVDAMLSK